MLGPLPLVLGLLGLSVLVQGHPGDGTSHLAFSAAVHGGSPLCAAGAARVCLQANGEIRYDEAVAFHVLVSVSVFFLVC